MDGNKRRKKIIEILNQEKGPVSGAELAKRVGVSRQVVVQDVALMRAEQEEILSTNKGYVLRRQSAQEEADCIRVFCASHTTEDTLNELYTIVDYGGRLLDVFIEHEVYGQIHVDLIINNRLDAEEFMEALKHSGDQPLKILTNGCHYHTVAADSKKNLDRIEQELKKKGYLAK
ncbi:transcription repressor NadR [Lacrimispora sp.]|uniref:transcription repressor NadR n=1 Tax=Lacrimispora sp. TaxID=2719234 RepID=UPI00399221CA